MAVAFCRHGRTLTLRNTRVSPNRRQRLAFLASRRRTSDADSANCAYRRCGRDPPASLARPRRLCVRVRSNADGGRCRSGQCRDRAALSRAVRSDRDAESCVRPSIRPAAPLAPCLSSTDRRSLAAWRPAHGTTRADPDSAPSTRTGNGGRARSRLARSSRRRCGPGQNDRGGVDHRGAARARTCGTHPHRDAVGTSRSMAQRARGSLRHRRRSRRRRRDSPSMPDDSRWTEPVDHDADRRGVDRLPEAARGPAIGAGGLVGRRGRRRSARSGCQQRAVRRGFGARGTSGVCRAADGNAAQRRSARVCVALRHRCSRRSAAGVPAHQKRGEPRCRPPCASPPGATQRRRDADARAPRGFHARRQIRTQLRRCMAGAVGPAQARVLQPLVARTDGPPPARDARSGSDRRLSSDGSSSRRSRWRARRC